MLSFLLSAVVMSIAGLAVSDDGSSLGWYNKSTCNMNVNGCWNPCARQGKTCCYCDETKNYQMLTCSCCPKDHVCCPANPYTKYTGGTCCPSGSICQNDGTCLIRQNAIYSEGLCGQKCRPSSTMYITVDNYFYLYLDGIKYDLSYPKDWERVDAVPISGGVKTIAVWGENDLYEAGILASSSDGYILSNYKWKCTRDVSRYKDTWMMPNFDDSDWGYAYESDQNVPGGGRRHVVDKIDRKAWWVWCNRVEGEGTQKDYGWEKMCYCRLTLYYS